MNIIKFADGLKFKILGRSMRRLGLDPDEVDTRADAVQAIYDHFSETGLEIMFECGSCKGDLPDLDFCPFCGSSLIEDDEDTEEDLTHKSKGIPGELYRGARRGRLPKDEPRIAGTKLLARLVFVFGMPNEYVRQLKSVTSLWCHWGMFARCFVGAYSVRLHLPFEASDYEDPNEILIDHEAPVKNMKSRFSIESLDEIEEAVEILKKTVNLKKEAADEKKRCKEAGEKK